MAVQTFFVAERDGLEKALAMHGKEGAPTMIFQSKAEADARDKVLELGESLTEFLLDKVDGLSDELADRCAMAIAENRDLIQKALKKPSLLTESSNRQEGE